MLSERSRACPSASSMPTRSSPARGYLVNVSKSSAANVLYVELKISMTFLVLLSLFVFVDVNGGDDVD